MKAFSAIAFIVFARVATFAQEAPKQPAASATPIPQQLRIRSQPDAPLRIVSADITWATPSDRFAVQVYPVVENVSQKPVLTYSTRWEYLATGADRCLGPPASIGANGLLPGEKAGTSTWQGDTHFEPAPEISIDFVEFTDGSRWGADKCMFGERIDGSRAGGREQRDQLLKIFRAQGADALMTFIRNNFQRQLNMEAMEGGIKPLLPLSPPPGHSKRWREGFLAGGRGLIERVIEAEHKWGPDEIEHELMRPIGPEEKKKP